MPLVSVIVTVYNQRSFLGETLRSVSNQTYRPLECIVIDDGSTDRTPDVISEFANSCGKADELTVKSVRQANMGAQAARNAGLARCTGDFIQYLDGDDLLMPDKLTLQTDFMGSSTGAEYDVVYGDAQWLLDEGGQPRNGEHLGLGPVEDFIISALGFDRFNPVFSYLCRRRALEKAGKWDLTVLMNQDQHYFLSLACRGGTFAYLPGLTGFYRKHNGRRTSDAGIALRAQQTFKILASVESMLRDDISQFRDTRRSALARAYLAVSRWAFAVDKALWREALLASIRLCPSGPQSTGIRGVLQNSLGVWAAETIAGVGGLVKRRALRRTG